MLATKAKSEKPILEFFSPIESIVLSAIVQINRHNLTREEYSARSVEARAYVYLYSIYQKYCLDKIFPT